MKIAFNIVTLLALSLLTVNAQSAPSASPSTSHACDASHFDSVDQRGDKGMGFSHTMTHHHFHLLADGGAIEVEANKPDDTQSREAIRQHIEHISKMFADGDFSLPMFIHSTEPPGMKTMQRLKSEIAYSAENTPLGAQVRIKTNNRVALNAIHDFLRFQIVEHRTGDPTNR
jgi:hypothetical protein